MEKIVEHGLLYDFYGELLTAHQRQIYEDAVYHDMSLTEIADIQGISRQGVHDLLRRCDRILEQYEAKLGLVKRFALIKEKAQRIGALAKELSEQEESGAPAKELSEQKESGALAKKSTEQDPCRERSAPAAEQITHGGPEIEREKQEKRRLEKEKAGIGTTMERLAAIRKLSGEILEEL